MVHLSEIDAHWAALSFERLLELGPDGSERAELLTSGVSRQRVDVLYPPEPYPTLLQNILPYLRDHVRDLNLAMVKTSNPGDLRARKVDFDEELTLNYRSARVLGEGSSLSASPTAVQDALVAVADFDYDDVTYIHSLLWHAWWMMTNRERMTPHARHYADELLLASIEYILPSLKSDGQPKFAGFTSEASDELY